MRRPGGQQGRPEQPGESSPTEPGPGAGSPGPQRGSGGPGSRKRGARPGAIAEQRTRRGTRSGARPAARRGEARRAARGPRRGKRTAQPLPGQRKGRPQGPECAAHTAFCPEAADAAEGQPGGMPPAVGGGGAGARPGRRSCGGSFAHQAFNPIHREYDLTRPNWARQAMSAMDARRRGRHSAGLFAWWAHSISPSAAARSAS